MTITLPDDVARKAEAHAKAHGFATVEAYIEDLVQSDDAADDPPILRPENRATLERLLDEGMASGEPIPVDEAFWEERRRVLAERMARRRADRS